MQLKKPKKGHLLYFGKGKRHKGDDLGEKGGGEEVRMSKTVREGEEM